MHDLSAQTVTFLFTDIEGSTQLLQHMGDARVAEIFADHRRLLRAAFEAGRGRELETQGDGFQVVFLSARDAILTAIAGQRAVTSHPWPEGTAVRVRMGLHTGEPVLAGEGYVGLDVHRAARICAVGWGGQILLSQATAQLVRDDLPLDVELRDLGSHRLKDLQRAETVFQVLHPELPSHFPPLRSLDRLPNNLPVQLTSFIGREREIDTVKRLLSTARLVTLTGWGGAGKTRLALQVAADLVDQFQDGVWLVELASLSDSVLVPQTVAGVLQLHERPGRPMLATLTDYLQPRHLLLLLDNCEHLVASCAHLVDALLRACPNLRLLVTSREALGINGETVWLVPSLSCPDPHHLPPADRVTQYEAVRLFTDRASAALPEFRITPQNARGIAEVCYRLDGIPLAIELAAARVKALSVEQITERLDDRFRLLTGGSRTALPRHQTLLATMDWSYALLSEKERACLRRLSVFAGWTLEAVEAACGWGDVGEAEVFDLLSGLINKSLIVVDHLNGAVRYRMPETIRQYARQKLQDSGEETETRRRHRDWYLKLAEQAEPELHGPAQATWVERLEVEHDNLRAAMYWSQKDREDTEAGLRLAAAMWRFWWMRGDLTEGRRWLESLLNESPTSRTPARACALVGAGMLAWLQGDYPTATNWWEESLRLARLLNDAKTILDATNGLGLLAITRSDYVAARALYEEALGQARALGDTRRIAVLLNNLGLIAATQGEYATARMLLQESLALSREQGRLRNMFHSLNNLGLVAEAEGDQTSAGRLFEESLRISKDLGYKLGLSHALKNLALVAHRQGDDQRAAAMAEESLALARELGDRDCISDALILLGRLAYRRREDGRAIALWVESLSLRRELGDKPRIAECLERLAQVDPDRSRAARLLGAAAALRETIGAPLAPVDRPDWEQCVAAVRAALGRAVFQQAQEEGRLTPLDRLLVDLLALRVG